MFVAFAKWSRVLLSSICVLLDLDMLFRSCCCACACSTNMEGHHAFNLARGYDEIMKLFGRKFRRFELPDEDEYV